MATLKKNDLFFFVVPADFPALSNYNLRMDTTKEPSAYLPQAYNYGPYGQYATVAVKEE